MIRKAVENIAKKLFPWWTLFFGSALYLCNTNELLANNCLSTTRDKKASNSQEVEDIICRISPEDRTILERFFKELICFDCYGYVLFGNKPMAFATFENQIEIQYMLSLYSLQNNALKIGWQIWNKYQGLFNIKNYIFRVSQNPVCPEVTLIVLINKSACLKILSDNLKIFRSVLGDGITPEEIVLRLETEDTILDKVLNHHDGLLGMLLGYGVHNSMMYQRRIQLAKQNKNPLIPSHNKGISQNKRVNLTSSAPDHDLLSLVGFPRYAEDPLSKESQSLRKDYAKTQAELHQRCEEGDFLQLTLNRLVQ